MMKRIVLTVTVIALGALAAMSCRRADIRSVTIDVPQMSDAKGIRIVTNAALNEVVGRYDGIRNDYEIDLAKQVVFYHESRRLLSAEYQRRIEARIAEVGFKCRLMGARLEPPAPVLTGDGPVQMWPDRFTAVISVPGMASNTDANIVVDAIACARVGGDDPRVSVNGQDRRVAAAYESLHLSRRNIEYAIACVGFDANDVPACLGRKDAIPHGWTHVNM